VIEWISLCGNIQKYGRKFSQVKVFGNKRGGSRVAVKPAKQKKPLKTLAIVLTVVLCLEGLYFFALYSTNSFVTKWRNIYINTAMNTMTHQWLATYFIPPDIIQDVRYQYGLAIGKANGIESGWTKKTEETAKTDTKVVTANVQEAASSGPTAEELEAQARTDFYSLFWEIDKTTMDAYVQEHPEALANGWGGILINEANKAGTADTGTSIQTTMGEQVLTIDVKNQILIVRITGSGYKGVLAIAKNPAQLSVQMASTLGSSGQLAGDIASAHNGILAMNASGFGDPGGNGNGGQLAGYAMSDGTAYGSHFGGWAYKRIELHQDNLFYIKDVGSSVASDCTDAIEFQPAMIIDGKKVVDSYWTGTQPRACIGQSDKYEILMLVIEGRNPLAGILGTDVNTCSEILLKHNCMQALNVDGGSSAILWYNGEYLNRSSSGNPYNGGRPLPDAFVYQKSAS
jgi:exopolysaccharide biosynthesis protein